MIRLRRAVVARDTDAVLTLTVIMLQEGMWLVCWCLAAVSFVSGFFAPHCFITALLLVVLAAMCRSNCDTTSGPRNGKEVC